MSVFRHYRCPDCGGTFRHFHRLRDDPPPDFCEWDPKLNGGREGCGVLLNDDLAPVFVPQAPGIRKSPYVKSVDQVYRNMETSSIDRAREAADMAGVSESAMSHLKITNMKDPSSVREGESSAILPPLPQNPIGAGFNPLTMAGGQAMSGAAFALAARGGDGAGTGEGMRAKISSSHNDRAWAMQQRGQMRPTYYPKG
ncbi:MAG TPA: hypothetical protein VGR84_19025 [Candidatus Acidoferrales bacterium]|nr:hypothetical protein [Candidatus Acidoferrales bacterium]